MGNINSTLASLGEAQQFGRQISCLVSNKSGKTLDLSQLRIKFAAKKLSYKTPNSAVIIIYNLDLSFAMFLKNEFTSILLQAGYAGNYGTIFKGNIRQAIIGRENQTDTFVSLNCGDGDQAYNFAVVNKTIGSAKAGGSSPANQLDAAVNALGNFGVGIGQLSQLPQVKLPRGKVMYGSAQQYVSAVADTNGFSWSIQDEELIVIPEQTYLNNQVVVLTSKSGMIGTPTQTTEGVNVKCLLNPKIKCHSRVQIDNRSVQQYQIDVVNPGNPANTPSPLTSDGMYYVLVAEHTGDTRGTEWYTNMVLLYVNPAANPLESVGSV